MVAFLFAVILSGAASAAESVHFSSDGKNITVTHDYVKSTLVTHVTTKKGYGNYGYGKYVTITTSGKDNEGRNSIQTLYTFNGKSKQMVYKLGNSDHSVNGVVNFYNTRSTMTITGKDSATGASIKATGVSLYRTIAGQKYVGNTTINMSYTINGKVLARLTQFTTYQYKAFKSAFYAVKSVRTTNTTYAIVGFNKKSVINSYYTRNSIGMLTGLKVSGTSKGTEIINNKLVNFTGKITISTKYDPKDIFSEGFSEGDYKEVLTSSSPTLLKIYPIEA
ncbi:MAG: hypothetical protein NKF70_09570 [Methanobacterium sp. ERen5]|nr:MAG: hypothetical protein NKF70_09570 [Methanobacterium sp. ERen5]